MSSQYNQHSVLLVENNQDDILLTQRAFQKAKFTAELAVVEDGDLAIHYLNGYGQYSDRARYPLPTLLLLDLKLPRRSGFEVIEWIRADTRMQRLPVVILSSSNQKRDINLAYKLGGNSYIVKPFGDHAFQDMINKLGQYWFGINWPPQLQH